MSIKATINTQSKIIPSSVNVLAGAGTVVGANFNSPVIISGTLKGNTKFLDTPTFSSSPQIPGFKITSNTPNVRTELGLSTNTSPKTLIGYTKITNSPNDNIIIESQRGPDGGGDISLVCGRDFTLSSDTLQLNGSQLIMGSGLANMFKLDSTGTGMSNLINVNGATNQVTINGPLTITADLKITGLPTYDSESAAASAELAQDTVYKTSTGELRIKL